MNNNAFKSPHGSGVRGSSSVAGSPLFEGKFGRMFRNLPALEHSEDDLLALAQAITIGDHDAKDGADGEESHIPAGYTYFGQFVDHDLTFDPASSLQKMNDPDALVDFRTPRFDLDNIYGRGPDDQPYLYTGKKFILGTPLTGAMRNPFAHDLPRSNPPTGRKRAIIGDPRNDENVIVSQLESTFHRFHNRLVDDCPTLSFAEVQTLVRWHYQYIVLNDFLPRLVNPEVIDRILPNRQNSDDRVESLAPRLAFYHYRNDPYIPIEFSAAAYRLGHSMVRPGYRLNEDDATLLPIFNRMDPNGGLNSFDAFKSSWAIDWHRFLEMDHRHQTETDRVQYAYKIDTSMVDPLKDLPGSVVGDDVMDGAPVLNLAFRNLLRGQQMGLPSGESVALAMGLVPMQSEDVLIGKALEHPDEVDQPAMITDISANFEGKTPLWVYILAEAAKSLRVHGQARLGPVGAQIVAEVFIGLLHGDPTSFLSVDPRWQPEIGKGARFDLADFVQYAIEKAEPSPSLTAAIVVESTTAEVI
ncbi:MAG: heme peroxidase [Armatimonadetes bacterium]|nr:heme peroxidase [Armatimonadota bacterium]